ncbi:NAD(P)H-binding protein [Trinickia caryophylli]|uniref:NAD(P)H dehydrogenase (Quinone) n=1 Tax=Trinickia caryophylli TaxID=28094 RepID=A0A1X7H881_TRICW|nr:NAD(P)H-binding protein [Trinickia caryophylli]PMS09488.1 NAD(P)-dependent oxidoreductase [Trinickia caryophylli]TRX14079.1 SDR family NAD(P)-dependent oxidoreductase [Trinickia caryophylli]WQE13899.1 NAD(P)H-binding protein [Trinickia caryophylli]SMF81498.1 NAD(P)H dehydrogenase (quinone) [Trinickia caryophylli]GLU35759.1 NAD(P)-dependent oxidoreductase [Trinickia caryophylli]
MKIGVSGASGQLGKAIVQDLIASHAGHGVVGISRSLGNIHAPAEGRFGDYDQPASLAAAYQGLDAVVLIPSDNIEPGARVKQFVTAIDAAVEAGVKHIVLVSVAGTKDLAAPSMYVEFWGAEQHLMSAAASWTILRMNLYAEVVVQEAQMLMASGALIGLGEESVGYVAREDLASAAAAVLVSGSHAGAIYEITGPERLAGAEKAAIVAEVTGKPLGFAVVTEDQFRGGMAQAGLPGRVVDLVVQIKKGMVGHAYDIVTGHFELISGRKPRPLRDVIVAAFS